jgi:hypothetical protein
MLTGGMATPQQLTRQYLTPQEQQGIAGSPFAARDISVGQLDQLRNMQTQGETRQREAVGGLERDLRGAVNPDLRRVSEGYYPEMQRLISNAGRGYEGIIDPNFLGVRPEYYQATGGSLRNLSQGYGAAVDPRYLSLSGEFQERYDWTPQDSQAMVDLAGREVGQRAQAREDALMRSSAAAGNTDPLALEAARNRNKIYGDIASQAAMTDARSRAGEQQRATTMGRESMRLGSEQDISNRAMRGFENLAASELNQANVGEQMRLGAERDISNRALGAWDLQTQRAIENWRDYENMRRGAETGLSDRLAGIGSEIGQTRLGTERGIGQQQQQLGQYRTGMLADLTRYGESEGARRAYDLARNRQDVGYAGSRPTRRHRYSVRVTAPSTASKRARRPRGAGS